MSSEAAPSDLWDGVYNSTVIGGAVLLFFIGVLGIGTGITILRTPRGEWERAQREQRLRRQQAEELQHMFD